MNISISPLHNQCVSEFFFGIFPMPMGTGVSACLFDEDDLPPVGDLLPFGSYGHRKELSVFSNGRFVHRGTSVLPAQNGLTDHHAGSSSSASSPVATPAAMTNTSTNAVLHMRAKMFSLSGDSFDVLSLSANEPPRVLFRCVGRASTADEKRLVTDVDGRPLFMITTASLQLDDVQVRVV